MGGYGFPGSGPTFNGVPLLGGIPTGLTKTLFVDYGNGSDSVSEKSNSVSRPFKTIDKAYGLLTTNKNEGIALMGSSSHALTSMLTVAKNRVHFFGYDPGGRMFGQNAKISLGVTAAATDIGTILNTGIRNSFHNIKFTNANTVAQGIYCFVEGGEYTVLDFCEIYKETDLDVTGASELVMNGDSATIRNCVIGSTANAISGDVIRANVRLTAGLAGAGKVSRDVVFDNCLFWKRASHVNNRFFYGANATDVERMLLIRNSVFFNTKLASALPAQCVAFGAEQTQGFCLIDNCTSINNTKLSTTTGVYVSGPVPTYATSGISVAS
jgi:hypothetical protein